MNETLEFVILTASRRRFYYFLAHRKSILQSLIFKEALCAVKVFFSYFLAPYYGIF